MRRKGSARVLWIIVFIDGIAGCIANEISVLWRYSLTSHIFELFFPHVLGLYATLRVMIDLILELEHCVFAPAS